MGHPLRMLILEDRPADAELMAHMLRNASLDFVYDRVDTEQDYVACLSESLDLILADYSLPQFTALDALRFLQERGLDIPFIVVTGSLEEGAIECLRLGAADYLVKDRLGRLEQAIRRALEERKLRAEKQSAERALRASEERFRRLAENARDLIYRYRLSPAPGFDYVSPSATTIVGYTPEEHYADPDLGMKLIHPEDRPLLARLLSDPQNISQPVLLRWLHKNGSIIWIEQRIVPIFGEDGQVAAIEGIGRDVTRQRAAEIALRESEEHYRKLVDLMPETVLIQVDGIITFVNPAGLKLFGASHTVDVVGKPILDLIHPDYRDLALQQVRAARAHGASSPFVEGKIIRLNGKATDVEAAIIPFDHAGQKGLQAIVRDITDRRAAEERIRRLLEHQITINNLTLALGNSTRLEEIYGIIYERVRDLMDAEMFTVAFYDDASQLINAGYVVAQGKVLDVSAFQRISLEEVGLDTQSQVIHSGQPLYIPDLRQALQATKSEFAVDENGAISSGPPPEDESEVARSALLAPMKIEGKTIGVVQVQSYRRDAYSPEDLDLLAGLANVAAIAIQSARLYRELETYSQILEQAVNTRTAELESTNAQLQTILNNHPDPILLLGDHGQIEIANPAFYRMFQMPPTHPGRISLTDLVLPEYAGPLGEALEDVIVRAQTRRLDLVARREDGTTLDASLALAPVQDHDGMVQGVCSLQDISSRKEVERLKDAFVSNVSHELRTPITSIKLNLKLIPRQPDRADVILGRLNRESERLARIIEDLLFLSRLEQNRIDVNLGEMDINLLAEEYVVDRTPLAEENGLKLTLKKQVNIPPVEADRGLVGQVLSILLTNALSYTPAGGSVVVSTHRQTRGDRRWVGLRVSDTGHGIPPAEQASLFERFFRGSTGRASGLPGTGLGLTIAREIVQRHHGRIEVKSEGVPGKGTAFSVWLPAGE